jgi:hypothetical protein
MNEYLNSFLINDGAQDDPIILEAARLFLEDLEREEARRQRVREGLEERPTNWGDWNISDRD